MVQRIKTQYIFILLLILPFQLYSQTTYPSAYSSFGIGTISNGDAVKNKALGGSGVALKTNNFINTLNPASLTGIDSLNMLIDLGLTTSYIGYQTNEGDGNAFSGNLNNISLAFKSSPFSYTSFGISQVSSVSYNIDASAYVDQIEIDKDYEGDGGVNEVYLSNAVSPFKNLSLGLKASYLFGYIQTSETYYSSYIGGSVIIDYDDYVKQFTIEPGIQYSFKIKNSEFGIGATYRPEVNFVTESEINTYASSGASISEEIDEDDEDDYKMPETIRGGLSWNNKGLTLAADYRFMQWSSVYYSASAAELKDSHRISGGAQYQNMNTTKASPILYQMGGYYEDSYIKVEGNVIIDYGINAGISIPMRNSRSYFNVGLNYGRRGTRGGDIITEKYYGMNLSLSIVEFWFMKSKFE